MKNNNNTNLISLIPLKSFFNISSEKVLIYKELRNKSGIYCWNNLSNGKTYVGSAQNLTRRLYNYLSFSYLEIYNSRYICRAILKYGHDNFSFNILTYCDVNELIKWEQYYIDKLKPEYNLLKVAKSSLGFKHSPATILKFKNRKYTPELLKKYQLGRVKSQGHTTIVLDKKNKSLIRYDCIQDAAKSLGTNRDNLQYYIKNGKLYKKNYLIVKLLKISDTFWPTEEDLFPKKLIREDKLSKKSLKPIVDKEVYKVKVINLENNEFHYFSSIRKAAKFIGMHHAYITESINKNKIYKGKEYHIIKELIT